MSADIISFCNRTIRYSFYALFFLVPIVFAGNTFELFEFNKMWVTFALTIVIGCLWITKMIARRQIRVQKTPLDIPIVLFLISQFISTIFSLDTHMSFWGYYSRFNGGFYSLLSYAFLYYAFVSNAFDTSDTAKSFVKRCLYVSLFSGLFVALWGLPSHFGYDPTCLVFRGTFDVSCWTDAFHPTVRIFSTLGQPNWLASYLAVLLPLAVSFAFVDAKKEQKNNKSFLATLFILLTALFYADIIYTGSRSGYLGLAVGGVFFIAYLLFVLFQNTHPHLLKKMMLGTFLLLLLLTAILGTPFTPKLTDIVHKGNVTKPAEPQTAGTALETGGTESGTIRLIVWKGAIDAWKHYPIFGTGVETFAFAYYLYRPAAHNLTSEWDYLYNKAHNEYLNYLTTTGIVGLGTYLLMIGIFFVVCGKYYYAVCIKKNMHHTDSLLLTTGLLAGYLSILVSNFLGFSVVILNIYLFLIPAFVFLLLGTLTPEKAYVLLHADSKKKAGESGITTLQWLIASVVILYSLFLLLTLFRFWQADVSYAYGYNLDRVGEYDTAQKYLKDAVDTRDDEPVFKDELSSNEATLALYYAQQKDAQKAEAFAKDAIDISNDVITNHPNNVVFWKTRVRVFYSLSQINPQYLQYAVQAIQEASILAPTDAKIWYNLGVLTGQNGDSKKAVAILQHTIMLKSDYRDAYFALGLFYRDLATDKNKKVVNEDYEKKAVDTLHYSLDHFGKNDKQILDTLKAWGEQ